jgi:hypothetical protein
MHEDAVLPSVPRPHSVLMNEPDHEMIWEDSQDKTDNNALLMDRSVDDSL